VALTADAYDILQSAPTKQSPRKKLVYQLLQNGIDPNLSILRATAAPPGTAGSAY